MLWESENWSIEINLKPTGEWEPGKIPRVNFHRDPDGSGVMGMMILVVLSSLW